ncbi:hypothetical protein LZP69_05850 [Shewanella sp. AS1]|uniref:hypothetical protein n=1 Tax=Shewanella sp. AS1 TaxID=2907626 RepID=UPI001F25A430|nr:hypothetical protein [Shewanella sp. AS1]MCE9678718.1 hypothetical protein [Shewanella sp. AS1]
MKLKHFIPLLISIALLAPITGALATSQKQIEFKDDQTKIKLTQEQTQEQTQKKDKITKVIVDHQGKQYSYQLSNDEVQDDKQLKSKLTALPEATQEKVIHLIKQLDGRESSHVYLRHSAMSEADKQKLASLTKKMAKKEAELAKHVAKIEKKIIIKSAEMEAKRAKMEAKAAELEQQAREFEIILQEDGMQMDEQIELASSEIAAIAEQMAEIEIKYAGEDLHKNGSHRIVIHKQEKPDIDQVIKLIESDKLSDAQKQKLEQALTNSKGKSAK